MIVEKIILPLYSGVNTVIDAALSNVRVLSVNRDDIGFDATTSTSPGNREFYHDMTAGSVKFRDNGEGSPYDPGGTLDIRPVLIHIIYKY